MKNLHEFLLVCNKVKVLRGGLLSRVIILEDYRPPGVKIKSRRFNDSVTYKNIGYNDILGRQEWKKWSWSQQQTSNTKTSKTCHEHRSIIFLRSLIRTVLYEKKLQPNAFIVNSWGNEYAPWSRHGAFNTSYRHDISSRGGGGTPL